MPEALSRAGHRVRADDERVVGEWPRERLLSANEYREWRKSHDL
jgi:hypothetical protein